MKLDKKEVKKLFEDNTNQTDVLLGLFKMVIPQWDDVAKVEGFPEVNESTWISICKMFREFDEKNHPGVMPAGLWMNTGFSKDENLSNWWVSTARISLVMKVKEKNNV